MTSRRPLSPLRRCFQIAATGAVLGLAGLGWAGGTAWASARASGGHALGQSVHADAQQRHRGPTLPVIGNATNLSLEPVVHATKGTPPTTLEVKNLVVGTGATVKASSTVTVIYVGANYQTGKDFTQATWTDRHAATAFPLSSAVRGFREGLVGMKVGGRREIVIPPKLGYGAKGTGPIQANETLVFVVDLKSVSG